MSFSAEPSPDQVLNWDATPLPHSFYSVVAQKMSVVSTLCELIDNAFDAGAKRVEIEWGKSTSAGAEYMVIKDDGSGIREFSDLATLGKRTQHTTTKEGRFGVGGTEAILWAGGANATVIIESTRDGQHRRVVFSWKDLTQSKTWKMNPRMSERAARPGERGTTITIQPYIHKMHNMQWLSGQLGYLYWPGLRDSRSIRLRTLAKGDIAVDGWQPPEKMTDVIEQKFTVRDRAVSIRAGIVPDGIPNPKNGLTYVHHFRVIEPHCSLGCKSFDTGKVCGVVDLISGWNLSKHKDEIIRGRHELEDAIFDRLKPMLEKAESMAQILESASLFGDVEAFMNRLLGAPDKKAQRDRGETHGTKNPTGQGGRHRRAKKEQNGATFVGRRGEAVRIVPVDWSNDVENIGAFDGKSQITINRYHPSIASAMRDKNRLAIAITAAALLCGHQAMSGIEGSGQLVLRGIRDLPGVPLGNFYKMLGAILAKPMELDGRLVIDAPKPVTHQPGGLA